MTDTVSLWPKYIIVQEWLTQFLYGQGTLLSKNGWYSFFIVKVHYCPRMADTVSLWSRYIIVRVWLIQFLYDQVTLLSKNG